MRNFFAPNAPSLHVGVKRSGWPLDSKLSEPSVTVMPGEHSASIETVLVEMTGGTE